MRFSGPMPWKPATTATSPFSMRAFSVSTATPVMRAARWAPSVVIGICQPCQDRALTPIDWSTMASSPEVTCSPEATTASYSRASYMAETWLPFFCLKPQASSTQATS